MTEHRPIVDLQSIRMPSWVSLEPSYNTTHHPHHHNHHNHPSPTTPTRSCRLAFRHPSSITDTTTHTPTISSPKQLPVQRSSPPSSLSLKQPSLLFLYQEPTLSILCRQKKWEEVILRCHQHPEEAVPVPYSDAATTPITTTTTTGESWENGQKNGIILYHETPLGLACRSNWSGFPNDFILMVLETLIRACPLQVDAHQCHAGHTPLRDVIQNSSLRYCNTPAILKLLLLNYPTHHHHESSWWWWLYTPDRDQYTLMDHLLLAIISRDTDNKPSSSSSNGLESLRVLLDHSTTAAADVSWPTKHQHPPSFATRSPLIRFLSRGTSLNLTLRDSTTLTESSSTTTSSTTSTLDTSTLRLERIVQATRLVLQYHPSLLYVPSHCTKCTLLHVALRNYGNYLPLIQLLLQQDDTATTDTVDTMEVDDSVSRVPLVLQRNQYGDLPLHVACSVGVPWDVLTLVVQETLRQEQNQQQIHGRRNRLLSSPQTPFLSESVWSVNHSGYTPVDLEWVRHIEAGKGLLAARSFYPLEVSGIRKHCRKQDDFYRDLLADAVRQVVVVTLPDPDMNNDKTNDNNETDDHQLDNDEDDDEEEEEDQDGMAAVQSTFGLLLHRTILIIQAAFRGRVVSSSTATTTATTITTEDPCLLHAVAALCRPSWQGNHVYALPRPMLELFLWMCPHQILHPDVEFGRLPLHYAVSTASRKVALPDTAAATTTTTHQHFTMAMHHQQQHMTMTTTTIINDWMFTCQTLLRKEPSSAKIMDRDGRLPLHLALVTDDNIAVDTAILVVLQSPEQLKLQDQQQQQRARWSIVQNLVDCYPESVDLPDPITGLFPFQLAAACPEMSLEAVYLLLRRSPSLVLLEATTNDTIRH